MTTLQERTAPPESARTKPFIVSADCHVNEPGGLWRERIEARYRDRLPHVEERNGERWMIVEGLRPTRMQKLQIAPNAQDSGQAEESEPSIREIPLEGDDALRQSAGHVDPAKRLADHARDGVDAEVIYPNKGLLMFTSPDPDFQLAQCRVWNDWVTETYRDYFDRIMPVAAIAPGNVPEAVKEVERCAKLGLRALFLPVQVAGQPYNLPVYDPLWAAVQEIGVSVNFHIGTGRDPRTASGNGGAVINYAIHALATAMEPVAQLCASGVLERFPALKFATVEAGIGWLAWELYALDEAYVKHHMWVRPKLSLKPSDYFRRQGHATFQDDPIGLANRQFTGVDALLWGNDYPHHEGTWPHSQELIAEQFADLSDEERRKVLGLNAARLYGFPLPGA